MALSVASGTFTGSVSAATGLTVGSLFTVTTTAFTVGSGMTSTFNDSVVMSKTWTDQTLANVYGQQLTLTASPAAGAATNVYAGYFYLNHTTNFNNTGVETAVYGLGYNNSSGTITTSYGVRGISQNGATGIITNSIGVMGRSFTSNSGTMVNATGVYGDVAPTSTGNITLGIGVEGVVNNTGTATIATGYALHGKYVNSGGGAVTTYHGLHLDDPGTGIAAGNYNIYSAGTVYNFIAGRLGIVNPTPAYPLDVTGDINTTTCLRIAGAQTTGVCASDRRLKSNVRDYQPGLRELTQLQPKIYELNGLGGLEKGKEEVGFIAQDVEKVLPSLVVKRNVKLHEGDKRETEIEAVNYTRFLYIVFNSVKELYAKWEADHAKVEKNDQRVAQLEKKIELENLALKAENKALKERLDKIELALAATIPHKAQKGRKLATK